MSLYGNLEDLPFADLVEISSHRNQNCILRFNELANVPALAATVIIKNGIVYAGWLVEKAEAGVSGRLTVIQEGEQALQALLVCPKAGFSVEIVTSDYAFPGRNIYTPLGEILLESVFQAENWQTYWQEQQTRQEILLASKRISSAAPVQPPPLEAPALSHSQENTIKITSAVEITTRTRTSSNFSNVPHEFNTTPQTRANAVAPVQLPPVTAERLQPVPVSGLPRVQRGWISSLMDKIRSL